MKKMSNFSIRTFIINCACQLRAKTKLAVPLNNTYKNKIKIKFAKVFQYKFKTTTNLGHKRPYSIRKGFRRNVKKCYYSY